MTGEIAAGVHYDYIPINDYGLQVCILYPHKSHLEASKFKKAENRQNPKEGKIIWNVKKEESIREEDGKQIMKMAESSKPWALWMYSNTWQPSCHKAKIQTGTKHDNVLYSAVKLRLHIDKHKDNRILVKEKGYEAERNSEHTWRRRRRRAEVFDLAALGVGFPAEWLSGGDAQEEGLCISFDIVMHRWGSVGWDIWGKITHCAGLHCRRNLPCCAWSVCHLRSKSCPNGSRTDVQSSSLLQIEQK